MAAAGAASAATTTTGVLSAMAAAAAGVHAADLVIEIAEGRTRGAGRGRRRGTHAHVGQRRLITAMRQWLGGRAHRDVLLRKLLGELESVLRRHAAEAGLQGIEAGAGAERLTWGEHPHADVLLVCGLYLLLLLLQQLDLLLDGKLLHCEG